MMNTNLCVTRCKYGYGVKTLGDLPAGLVIMKTPYILISSKESAGSLEHFGFIFPTSKWARNSPGVLQVSDVRLSLVGRR